MTEQRVALKLTRPKNPVLLYALIFFLILGAAGEMVSRSAWIQDRVPYQAYGTNHTQMEIQLTNLETFTRENGMPDCFIFGSSQAFRGVDADVLAETIQAGRGGQFNCYNFGVTGSQVSTTALLNQILIEKYKPRLVIVGTSFLDYSEGREGQVDERFTENEWLAYKSGEFSTSGWLTENSYAWRYLTLVSYSSAYDMNYREVLREAHKWDGEIAPSGSALSALKINPFYPAADGFVKNIREELGTFKVSERNLNSLEQIVAYSRSVGASIIVVEMPYHPALLDLKDGYGNPRIDRQQILVFQESVNARIRSIASAHNATFIKVDSELYIPKGSWYDLYHLNRAGATAFSQWLGTNIARVSSFYLSSQAKIEGRE